MVADFIPIRERAVANGDGSPCLLPRDAHCTLAAVESAAVQPSIRHREEPTMPSTPPSRRDLLKGALALTAASTAMSSVPYRAHAQGGAMRSEEHTSELQSLRHL